MIVLKKSRKRLVSRLFPHIRLSATPKRSSPVVIEEKAMDTYLSAMSALLQNQPCTFARMIQTKATELELCLTPEGVNLLDGLLCQFVFVVVGTTQSLPRSIPSQKDYEYCLIIMGFGEYLTGPYGVSSGQKRALDWTDGCADLPTFLSEIVERMVNSVLDACKDQDCMIVEEMSVPNQVSEIELYSAISTLFKHTYLLRNSEFRKTNSAYIGPWKFNNGGRGNCLFYSLRQLITVWKAQRKIDSGAFPGYFFFSLWPEKPEAASGTEETSMQNLMRAYKKSVEKMEKDSHRLRVSSAKYFSDDLDALIPGEENKISFMKDGQVLNRRMTKADFIYTAKEGDLKLEPEFEDERKQWARAWCERAQQNGEWGCMRMITGFAHLIKEPRCIAMYFFRVNERERSRVLERTDEQTIKLEGCPEMVARDQDSILKLPVKRMEDEIRVHRSSSADGGGAGDMQEFPLKQLGLIVKQGTLEDWKLPKVAPQRHCALYHEGGRHWCVLVSAIQMEELRNFTNIDYVAKPLFT